MGAAASVLAGAARTGSAASAQASAAGSFAGRVSARRRGRSGSMARWRRRLARRRSVSQRSRRWRRVMVLFSFIVAFMGRSFILGKAADRPPALRSGAPRRAGAAGSLPTSISSPRGTKKLHFVTVYHSGFFPYRQPLIHGLRPFRRPKIGENAPFHKKFAIFSQFCPAGGGLSPAGGAPPPESPGAPRPSAPRAPPASVPTGPDRKGDLGIFARQKRENLPKTAAFRLASFRHPHYNISAVLIPRHAAPEILT